MTNSLTAPFNDSRLPGLSRPSRLAALILPLLVVGTAHAQMVPVSRSSRAYAWEHLISMGHVDSGTVSSEQTTVSFAPFDYELGAGGYTAIQHSSISASTVSVVARAYGTPSTTFGFGGGESSLVYVFDITDTATFHLEGSVASVIGVGIVSLSGPNTDLLFNTSGMQPTPFLYDGVLEAGRYQFTVTSTANYGSVSAVLTVVPVPAAGVLPAVLLIARRKRRGA